MSNGSDQPPYPPGHYPGQYPPGQYPPPGQPGQYPAQPPSQYGQHGQYPPSSDEMPTTQFSTGSGAYPAGPPSGYPDSWQGQAATWQGQASQPPAAYGYGAQYAYPGGPPPKKSKAGWWIGGGVLALVVVLAAVFVGIFALRNNSDIKTGSGPSKKTDTAQTNVLWRAPFTEASKSGKPIVAGVWVDEKAVMRGGGDGLRAYDIDTGKQLWSVPLPADNVVCSMAPSLLKGTGAFIYGAIGKYDPACDHLMAVDTGTGKQLWTADLKPVDGSGDSDVGDSYTSVSMATDVVVIQTSNVMRGYRTSDGTKRWGLVLKPKNADSIATCHPRDSLADGDRALIVVGCSGTTGYVTALNAQTGATAWDHNLTATEGDELFTDPISVRPAVLQSHNAGGDPHLLVLDDSTGHLARTIVAVNQGIELNFRSEGSRLNGAYRYPLVVKDGKLYGASVGDYGGAESKVVGLDLSTGQPVWTKSSGAQSELTVLGTQGTDLVALDTGGFDHTPRLIRFGLATGKRTDGVRLPKVVSENSFSQLTYLQGNRVILIAERPSASSPPIVVAGKP